jgi:hypothetical protein
VDFWNSLGYIAIAAAMYVKNKGANNVYLAAAVSTTDSIPRVKKYLMMYFAMKNQILHFLQ